MILGINSVCHTWHVVEYSCVLIFMKKRKEGKQKGRKGQVLYQENHSFYHFLVKKKIALLLNSSNNKEFLMATYLCGK